MKAINIVKYPKGAHQPHAYTRCWLAATARLYSAPQAIAEMPAPARAATDVGASRSSASPMPAERADAELRLRMSCVRVLK
jgi:hypothetical protein